MNVQNKRDVVIACDKGALDYASTTLYSFTVNTTQPALYRVTVVYFGDIDEAHTALANVVHPDMELRVVPGLSTYSNTPTCLKHLATPTFARLELSKYLPADCTRALWLDTDVLVVDDLDELFAMPFTTPVAAVRARIAMDHQKIFREMFNTGVMVVNVNAWQAADVETRCLRRITTNPRNCEVILNIILMHQCTYISSVFNYLQSSGRRCPLPAFNRMTLGGRTDVHAVHYQSGLKPWKYPKMTLAELWHMYAARHVDKAKQTELLTRLTAL